MKYAAVIRRLPISPLTCGCGIPTFTAVRALLFSWPAEPFLPTEIVRLAALLFPFWIPNSTGLPLLFRSATLFNLLPWPCLEWNTPRSYFILLPASRWYGLRFTHLTGCCEYEMETTPVTAYKRRVLINLANPNVSCVALMSANRKCWHHCVSHFNKEFVVITHWYRIL